MFNFTRARRAGALAVASGAAIVALAPGVASAAPAAPAGTAAVSHSQEAKTTEANINSRLDFTESGVRIYSSGNLSSAKVVGLGYPGQGFKSDGNPQAGSWVKCDDGTRTNHYIVGTDMKTHVFGYVPSCALNVFFT